MATKAEYKVRPHEGKFAVVNVTSNAVVSVHDTASDAATSMQRMKQHRRKQGR